MSVATQTRQRDFLRMVVAMLLACKEWFTSNVIEPFTLDLDEYLAVFQSLQQDGLRATYACRAGQDRDVVGVILTITIAAVVGFVGLTVMTETEDTTSFSSGSEFSNASDSLQQAVDTTFGLVEVVFIAVLLALIIGAMLFLRNR